MTSPAQQDLYNSSGFDSNAYMSQNADVANSGMTGWQHYDMYGRAEGRQYTPMTAGSVTPDQSIQQYTSSQVQTPVLPAVQTAIPQVVQANELMTAQPDLVPNGQAIAAPTAITAPVIQQTLAAPVAPIVAAQGTAQAVNPNDALAGMTQGGVQTNATYTSQTQQADAAQGTVNPNATVQGQMTQLMDFGPNDTPAWAKGAMTKANDDMAARGLGSSSIAAGAITAAVMQNALPIAAADASTYFQMDMKNLDNRQQAMLTNVQMAQQNMLTDTAIANANAQFNATNKQQSEQFVSSLISSITQQNAARIDAMTQLNVQQTNAAASTNQAMEQANSQFNASQANAIGTTNAANQQAAAQFNNQMKMAVDQYNSTLANQREQFNSMQRAAIDQSNALWRRTVNTSNNATDNAVNQANVQNQFNMSVTAQNDLWQQWRDEASWSFTASQNAATMAYNTATSANNREFNEDSQDDAARNAMLMQGAAIAANYFLK